MVSTGMDKRPRVLVIAEAANPEWVSVPLVGWSLTSALREVADVHLVTQVRNRDAILRAGFKEGKDFTAIDTERLSGPTYRAANILRMGKGKGWTTVTALAALIYPYFEWLVWQRFGPDIRAGGFDIVHRVTPLTPTCISPIARKSARAGVPFVIGPLNGGVSWPPEFDAERRREREWLSYVRGAYKALPGRGAMYAASAAILVGSRHTVDEMPKSAADKIFWLPENGIDPARFNRSTAVPNGQSLRAVFIGRLVPYKGPDMLIDSAADALRKGRLTLDIIGDGPMRPALEEQAAAAGVADAVTFHGQLSHQSVQDVAACAQIFTFPSIREFGGGVVLEAMALGVVPIVVDYAGPGELVDDAVGFKVPIGPRSDIISGFSALLDTVLADPGMLAPRARAARQRVTDHYTWSAKAAKVARVYDWVLSVEKDCPDLGVANSETLLTAMHDSE